MRTTASNTHVLYSVRAAAWLLGLPESKIHKAVRTGALPVVWRSGECLIPAHVLTRLLGEPEALPPDRCHFGRSGGAR